MNSSFRRVVLALAVGVLCAAAIGACGDDSSKKVSAAQRLLDQTIKATSTSLENGRLDARLQLEPKGLLALGGPISLAVKGPFVLPEGDGQPLLDLDAVVTVAGRRYGGGLISDGERGFLALDGKAYRLGDERSKKRLETLDLDPLRWIKGEQTKANERIRGTDTMRVTGTVDAARMLDDLDELVPAPLGDRIAGAVKSAVFDVWSGAEDKILRQFVLRVVFEVAKGEEPPIDGLEAGKFQLRIRLDDVNGRPPEIKAPAKSRPLSQVPTDRGLGGLLECLKNSARSGAELVQCVATLDP